MYVLHFFINAVYSAAESIFCIRCQPSSGRENVALVSEGKKQGEYSATATTRGGSSSQEPRGLTGEYRSWFESKTAIKYACGNLAAYILVAVLGFSYVLEDWPVYDSVYFAVVLFTTVGKEGRNEQEANGATDSTNSL